MPSGCGGIDVDALLDQRAQRRRCPSAAPRRRHPERRAHSDVADGNRDDQRKHDDRLSDRIVIVCHSSESACTGSHADSYTSDSSPVLSPTLSCGMPALSRIVSSRFDIGVFSGYFR